MSAAHPPQPTGATHYADHFRDSTKMIAQPTGAPRYVIHTRLKGSITCIDLVRDDPEEVMAGLREIFGKYDILEIIRL